MQLVARSSYERPQPLHPPPNRTLTFAIDMQERAGKANGCWHVWVAQFTCIQYQCNQIESTVPTLEHPGRFSSSCLELPQILSHVIPCAVRHLPYLEPLSRTLPSMLTGRTMIFHTGGTDKEAHPRYEQDQRSRSDRNSDEKALPPLHLKSK